MYTLRCLFDSNIEILIIYEGNKNRKEFLFVTCQKKKIEDSSGIDYNNLSGQEKDYVINRIDEQINWYDKKSKSYKLKFQFFSISIIVLSAIITIIGATFFEDKTKTFLSSLFAVLITISQGVLSLNKYNENWIERRTVCETLKKEKYMFITRSGVYFDNDKRFKFFVERVETIISQENLNWAGFYKNDKNNESSNNN